MNLYISIIRTTIKSFPDIVPLLKDKAKWIAGMDKYFHYGKFALDYKTYDYFLRELSRMVTNVYNNNLGGDFIDLLAGLIYGQLDQAYRQAWKDEGDGTDYPQYLADSFEEMYLAEFDHVDSYFRDIVTARLDQTSLEPLLARASIWANRYNDAMNEARRLIALDNGDNLEWVYGEAEHCQECLALNGIVARASDWNALSVKPQSPPNPNITCQGWNCACELVPTDKRRSRNSVEKIQSIISGA